MMLKRITVVIVLLLTVNACSYMPTLDDVIPDRRSEYRKSQALPDLEVPPDLTTEALQDPLAIPNEEVVTLSEYERRKSTQGTTAVVGAAGVDILADEQWLLVQGTVAGIWPELREFWIKKGYTLDLDDPELGVLETGWLETGSDGITVFRDKFSLFTESGNTPDTTIIFISGEKQEKIAAGENDDWIAIGDGTELEKQMVSELNLYFYGGEAPAGASSLTAAASTGSTATSAAVAAPSVASKPRAEMLNLGDDKVYLSLPHEFTRAWTLTEDAILKTGMFIENNDRDKGIYYVLYFDQEEEEEEGVLSRLKFWKDDEPEGQEYQISLTGVGDKTELVVLDNKGDWADRQEASKILTYIQVQYNNAIR